MSIPVRRMTKIRYYNNKSHMFVVTKIINVTLLGSHYSPVCNVKGEGVVTGLTL